MNDDKLHVVTTYQSEILLLILIKYFALDDNKTLHIFRLAQQDAHDNVWLDYPALDNW